MACRVGMATDVAARVQRLKDDRIVPVRATYRTIESGLTYKQANAREQAIRERTGCAGRSGGGYVAGRVWSVYRIDW